MKIHVLFSAAYCDELNFSGKNTIVIDVLRATTVIATALSNGAREIIPVGSIDFAMKISGNSSDRQTLLCGERNTKMIDGFNLGNSPFEYSKEIVEGKSIVLYTSNGTKSVVKAKYSDNLFTAAFVNLSSVVEAVKDYDEIQILCSGSSGPFCIEDTVCAGNIISELSKIKNQPELTDAGLASLLLYERHENNILAMLKNSEHGKLLIENGFGKDIEFCSQVNLFQVAPKLSNGVLKNISQIVND